jgi:hypothetical protein
MSWRPARVSRRLDATERAAVLRVQPGDAVAGLARTIAEPGLAPRALEIEALLHLPRLAGADGGVAWATAAEEIARLSRRLQALTGPAAYLARAPSVAPELRDLSFGAVSEELAATVMGRFHYLHSPRFGSLHLGSHTSDGRVAALVSLSELDLPTVAASLPFAIAAEEALVVSRVFAFDWAPQNTISHLLGRLERLLRAERPDIRFLVTYLNPNLGFDGASYRAANWFLFAHETGTRYAYLDGDYLTDRAVDRLPEADRRRVAYSAMPLAPLRIYARFLSRRDRRQKVIASVLPRP